MSDKKKLIRNVFLLGFLFSMYLIYKMALGYIHTIVFAGILAGAFYKVFSYFEKKLRGKKAFAALITIALIFVIVFLPIIYVAIQLSHEAIDLVGIVRRGINDESFKNFFFGDTLFAQKVRSLFALFDMSYSPEVIEGVVVENIKSLSLFLVNSLNSWLGNALQLMAHFVIMLIIMFSFFLWGSEIRHFFFKLSPLPDDQENMLLKQFNEMNYVTLLCNGTAGVIQGTLAGILFWILGIKSVFLWAAIMTILAFIPIVGMSLVYIPTVILLAVKQQWTSAIILFVCCSLISLVVENGFKPRFIGERIQMNPVLVFLSIMGGLSAFGVQGIFYGPLIVSLFLTLVKLYHENYAPKD